MEPGVRVPPDGPYDQVLAVSFHGETQGEAFDKASLWLSASTTQIQVLDVSWRRPAHSDTHELTIYFFIE